MREGGGALPPVPLAHGCHTRGGTCRGSPGSCGAPTPHRRGTDRGAPRRWTVMPRGRRHGRSASRKRIHAARGATQLDGTTPPSAGPRPGEACAACRTCLSGPRGGNGCPPRTRRRAGQEARPVSLRPTRGSALVSGPGRCPRGYAARGLRHRAPCQAFRPAKSATQLPLPCAGRTPGPECRREPGCCPNPGVCPNPGATQGWGRARQRRRDSDTGRSRTQPDPPVPNTSRSRTRARFQHQDGSTRARSAASLTPARAVFGASPVPTRPVPAQVRYRRPCSFRRDPGSGAVAVTRGPGRRS